LELPAFSASARQRAQLHSSVRAFLIVETQEMTPEPDRVVLNKCTQDDHGLMRDDLPPYYVLNGDTWTKID
jgi:hypothetical protein